MKREPALRRLSSDHHRALVAAKRLRDLPDEATADRRLAVAGETLKVWLAEVAPHFRAEEELLLPLFARFAGAVHAAIAETQAQHVALRAIVDALGEAVAAGEAPAAELLRRLGEGLRDHVRFEETVLFPAVEQTLPPAQMQRLLSSLSSE